MGDQVLVAMEGDLHGGFHEERPGPAPVPDSWFQSALQQGTAQPVCQAGGASVKTYLRKGKKMPERERWKE